MQESVMFFRLCVLGCLWFGSIELLAKLPNIVVFISDDLGRLETSVYGSNDIKTPNMKRLASRGMTFDNAYVASPSCCPNRFSLLTALMPARHGAHPNHSQVKEGTPFLLPILKSMGYHIASFGKIAHRRREHPGCNYTSSSSSNLFKNVSNYIDKNFDKRYSNQPVCLWVGDRRPHVPWTQKSMYDPDQVSLPSYFIDTKETREHWARYLTDITEMDEEMGRIYDFIHERFGEDFIFLFTSDHGGQWPFAKWNLYDAGTRIPLIVTWHAKIQKGVRSNAMISWVDIIPTLIDLAGGSVPERIDGRSFASVLLGEQNEHRSHIFTTHTGDREMNIYPMRSVRIGRYKYIHNLIPFAYHTNHSDQLRKDGAGAYWDSWDAIAAKDTRAAAILKRYYMRSEFEFFDLKADPQEQNNLIQKPAFAQKINALRIKLAQIVEEQGDALQAHRAPYPISKPLPQLR